MRHIAAPHPDAKRIMEIIADLDKDIVPPVPVPQMRAYAKRRNARLAADPPSIGNVENRTIVHNGCEVPVRIYSPGGSDGKKLPGYVHAHGGGFVVGDLDMADTVCRMISRDANVVVVSVDYRLAPEHKFPAGLNDTIAVTRWVASTGGEIGIDPRRLAIGGDSAGGNLAAATAQVLAGELKGALKFQVLVYPVTDLTCAQPSYKDLGEGYPLTEARMKAYIDMYVSKPADITDPRASPLLAKSLAGQPPAFVILAGLDPLVDEGRAYAERLRAAGISAEIADVPDHPHGFLGWTRDAAASHQMLALIAKRLHEHLD